MSGTNNPIIDTVDSGIQSGINAVDGFLDMFLGTSKPKSTPQPHHEDDDDGCHCDDDD